MWKTVVRIVLVTLLWAVASISAAAAGMPPAEADLLAGVGAGASLIAWSLFLHRSAGRTSQGQSSPPLTLDRKRATV